MDGGVESFQDDLTPNGVGGGVESFQDDSTPREAEGPRLDKTPGALTASRYRQGEYGWGQGGRERKPTHRMSNQGARARRRRRRGTTRKDGGNGQGDGDVGAGHMPEHFDGTDGGRSKHGALARRK